MQKRPPQREAFSYSLRLRRDSLLLVYFERIRIELGLKVNFFSEGI